VARLALACVLALAVVGCGGDSGSGETHTLLVAIDAPFSRSPYVGKTIANGAQLAVDELNAQGGFQAGGIIYRLRVKRYDNAVSPLRAVRNVRRAIDDGAIAIVDDGTGVDASWRIARDADVPICVTYGGGIDLVDEDERPNVFRIAPTDRAIAFRLAEYMIPKGLKVALLHDDTPYGQEGSRALGLAFGENPESVAVRLTLPAGASDLSPQVLRARRAGATALLVWGEGATIAEVLSGARSANWDVPVFAPPSAEEPIVRQQLADRPEWLEGLTFASGRMTAELGPGFFYAFQSKFEAAYGAQRVGVHTSDGREVVAPPDYAMYSYDFVNVLAAAVRQAGGPDGAELLEALEQVTVRGANGDERGFNERNHEGVVDDDVYFARFHDMTFRPVKDDPLSATLPVVEQRR
jgi:branched-chain amino acid transport system substrate-binding protein